LTAEYFSDYKTLELNFGRWRVSRPLESADPLDTANSTAPRTFERREKATALSPPKDPEADVRRGFATSDNRTYVHVDAINRISTFSYDNAALCSWR
jgi:hypothetical protein